MGRAVAIVTLLALLVPASVAAQEQEYERNSLPPVSGYTTDDGVIVLNDRDFCSYLLGSLFGRGKYIFTSGIFFEGKRPQDIKKMIRSAAFIPATDDFALSLCADALNQFRLPQRDPVPMPEWSLDHPVIPEAFAGLLAADSTSDGSTTPAVPVETASGGVAMSGTGARRTAPFDLTGGDYEAIMDLGANCSGDVDTWFAVLKRQDGDTIDLIEQSDYFYGVEAGSHYWDVTMLEAGCDWTLTLAPLSD